MYDDATLTTDALLGWVLAVGIAVCGWLLAFWGGGDTGHQALSAFPERIGAWSDDGDLALIGLLTPLAPLIILPGAFGSTLSILGIVPGHFDTPLIGDQFATANPPYATGSRSTATPPPTCRPATSPFPPGWRASPRWTPNCAPRPRHGAGRTWTASASKRCAKP